MREVNIDIPKDLCTITWRFKCKVSSLRGEMLNKILFGFILNLKCIPSLRFDHYGIECSINFLNVHVLTLVEQARWCKF